MEENKDIIESKKSVLGFILFSLVSGILFSTFFYNYVGISYAIFVIYLTVGFFIFLRVKNKNFMGYFLLAASLILSVSYAIFTNPVFRILNLLIVPAGLFSSFLLLTYSNITFELGNFIKIFFKNVFLDSIRTSIKLPKFVADLIKVRKKQEMPSAYKSIILGLVISIPVVFFLSLFLSKADEMFSYYVGNFIKFFSILDIDFTFSKLLWTLIITFFIFGLYWSLSYKFGSEEGPIYSKRIFEPLTVITILVVVTALYMAFTKVQVSYLYGSKTLPIGITHADYARNGFFQLVFLVVLNLVMITILKVKTKNGNKRLDLTLYILYTTITILTANMAFSALYKMNLYIGAFGYTRLRLLVQVFTLFLFLVLCLLIAFIWKNINLFKPILLSAAVIYLSLNFFNIDKYIVSKNIQMLSSTGNFDENYLTVLSLDADSAMKEALKEEKISNRTYDEWLKNNRNKQQHWYEYNYFVAKVNESGSVKQ